MRRRGLLLGLVLALGLGLAAGAIVMRQSARTAPAEAKKEKTVKVVVMAKKLNRGVKLGKADVQFREWPERLVNSSFIKDMKKAVGRVIVTNVIAGELLLEGKMAEIGSKEGLSTLISAGRRAFAIRVRDDTGVAGFLLPGSRVDVHATLEVEEESDEKEDGKQLSLGSNKKKLRLTKTILQDIEVLAAGGEKEAGQKKSRISTKVVTLSLTPGESDRLALAASTGSIWLSMRNPRDRGLGELKPVSTEDILYGKKVDSGKKEEKEVEKEKSLGHVVEIFHGGKKTKTEF